MPTIELSNLPVLERIRQYVIKTVGGISTQAGYQVNVVVNEPDRLGNLVSDGIYVSAVVQLGSAEWNKDIQCNNLVEWVQEFLIGVSCPQVETTPAQTMSADQMVILARSDIEKALDQDAHCGGLSANLTPAAPEWFNRSNGEQEGVTVRRFITYRTNWDDPYQLRA